MNLSAPFVRRPIATILLTIGLALAGVAAFFVLPVANLPQVDFPAISVQASLAGASPQDMAVSVATPLERRLGVLPGLNEITSTSTVGSTRINLQFDLDRNIDAAAREVQAAISAARIDLPATLRSNPTYRKMNPADQPVIILALTSQSETPGQIYDATSNIIQQRISQVQGVGDVEIGGGSQPAVRVEVLPFAVNAYGLSLEDVRAAVQAANANRPKGAVEGGGLHFQIYTTPPGKHAADYRNLVIAWRNGAAIHLSDVAEVTDGVQDIHTLGLFNGQPAVIVLVTQQPGANVIKTVGAVKAVLPQLEAELPRDIKVDVASDATTTIRASLKEVELTLVISIVLVILVVSAFLRSARASAIPAVATIVSLLGTFGAMYLFGFSLNNLSLMALTVGAGFVVDDAIVVLENTARHIEAGMSRLEAAMLGAREVGFTVLSISISLVAVFIPLLFMGGQVGRLFREFAVSLSAAVMISLVISLTTTPMLCAYLLPRGGEAGPPKSRIGRWAKTGFDKVLATYAWSLDWALSAKPVVMLILVVVIGLNVYLYTVIPKGFFPTQDTGRLNGGMRADQSISSELMGQKMRQLVNTIKRDPAVATVVGFTGGGRAGGGFMMVNLKPKGKARKEGAQQVIARLRPRMNRVTGISLFLNPQQDVRMGGRQSRSTYQYTLQGESDAELRTWATRLTDALKQEPALTDVDNDLQENGIETYVDVDKDTAGRLGVNMRDVDNALYDSFGQRQIATIYQDVNQYSVVMEVAPKYGLSPAALGDVYVPARGVGAVNPIVSGAGAPVSTALLTASQAQASASTTTTTTTTGAGAPGSAAAGSSPTTSLAAAGPGFTAGAAARSTTSSTTGASAGPSSNPNPALRDPSSGTALSTSARNLVPLSALATVKQRATPAAVNHQDAQLAATVTFNLADGKTLGDARAAIQDAEARIAMPTSIRGSFAGTARTFQSQLSQEPILILAALVAIYIVLGVLYESLIHPITVLSTLPSAGVGAVLALLILGMQFDIIGLIGVFLLIGIVKKNAILIIDFALDAQRARGLTATEAVREACLLRFRPILMTTLAAGLGALPLAIGFGEGSELRQPLGVAIIGGLIASQLLTLLTTPVVFVYLDRLRRRRADERYLSRHPGEAPQPV